MNGDQCSFRRSKLNVRRSNADMFWYGRRTCFIGYFGILWLAVFLPFFPSIAKERGEEQNSFLMPGNNLLSF